MPIPDIQARGIIQGDAFPVPTNLLAGDWPALHTDSIKAAAGLSFAQFEVFARNAAGEAIKFDQAGSAGANVAVGVMCQASTAAAQVLPYFKGGCFNHEALVWPAATDTLAERKLAFGGNPVLGVKRLI